MKKKKNFDWTTRVKEFPESNFLFSFPECPGFFVLSETPEEWLQFPNVEILWEHLFMFEREEPKRELCSSGFTFFLKRNEYSYLPKKYFQKSAPELSKNAVV